MATSHNPYSDPAIGTVPAGLVESATSDTEGGFRPRSASELVADRRLLRVYKSVSRSAELIQSGLASSGFRFRACLVTLTYRPDVYWGPRHVSEYLKHVRHWLQRRGQTARYVWVSELQRNGRVHYHLLFWLPRGMTMPKPDKQGWWPHGATRIEWARRAVGYLVKYTSKGRSKSGEWFPKGCRLSGFGGLDTAQREARSWWVLPRYQRTRCTPEERVRRARGGGWVSHVTGEWWPSYWPTLAELHGVQA